MTKQQSHFFFLQNKIKKPSFSHAATTAVLRAFSPASAVHSRILAGKQIRVSQRAPPRPLAAPSSSTKKTRLPKNGSSSPPRCSSASALRAMAPQIDPELLDRATEVAIEAAKEAGKRRGEFLVAEEDDERRPAMPFGFPTAPSSSSLTTRRRRASLRPLFLFSHLSLRRRASLRPLSPPQAPSSPLPSIRRPARPRAKSPACGTSSPPRTPRLRRPS